jgi:hypothetical protein
MVGGVQTPAGAVLTVQAGGSAPQPKSFSVSPSTITGGQTVQGTVTLTSPKPAGGAIVNLVANPSGLATLPSTVTVPAGSASATFSISTSAVTSSQFGSLTASYGGQSQYALHTVTPPATLPNFSTLFAFGVLFQPSGYASCTTMIEITPNGNGTYSTSLPATFTNGTVSGLTFTFNSIQSGFNLFSC